MSICASSSCLIVSTLPCWPGEAVLPQPLHAPLPGRPPVGLGAHRPHAWTPGDQLPRLPASLTLLMLRTARPFTVASPPPPFDASRRPVFSGSLCSSRLLTRLAQLLARPPVQAPAARPLHGPVLWLSLALLLTHWLGPSIARLTSAAAASCSMSLRWSSPAEGPCLTAAPTSLSATSSAAAAANQQLSRPIRC